MGEFKESVAVVYPSNWPPDDSNAHCTVVYMGEIPELEFEREDLVKALKFAGLRAPGWAFTTGVEQFGKDKDITVVTLQSFALQVQYSLFKKAMASCGIEYVEKWPEYKPHVTVKEPGQGFPQSVRLGAPTVWWGEDR